MTDRTAALPTPTVPDAPRLATVPTRTRYWVLAATAFAATNMYLDRACLSQVGDLMRVDLRLEEWQTDWVLGAFFWSYALFQMPAAALGVRFGFRRMLTVYLITWSVFTGLVGLSVDFGTVLLARLAVGLAEAGAYPTAGALVRNWFPPAARGRASSVVTLGGRFGWAVSQFLTPLLVVGLAGGLLAGWRAVLLVYAATGLVAGLFFWVVVRDAPAGHTADAAYAGSPESTGPAAGAKPSSPLPLRAFVRDRNLWLLAVAGFGADFSWAFLITKLPEFLTERLAVPVADRGWMSSIPAWVSLLGMLAGGFLTDGLVRRFGPRWGRSLPIGALLLVCGVAYLGVPALENPWAVVALLGVIAVGVDLGVPAWWAFCQDIGGRHTGAVLGWGTMWSNVGAALSPVVLGLVKRQYGWDAVFYTCAAAFAVAGVAAFGLNAAKPVRD